MGKLPLLTGFALTLVPLGLYAAKPLFDFQDGALTIRTDRYEARWENGCMTELVAMQPVRRELTVPGTRGMLTRLPNGLGSFHEQRDAARDQHSVVFSRDLQKTRPGFPAQHPATPDSQTTCEHIRGGVRLTYRGLRDDASALLVQELTVDQASGELAVRQHGTSEHSGVFGICFSLLHLRPDMEFAVPYFGGQRFGGALGRGKLVGFAWPQFWSAGFVIGLLPEGGSFLVFADDPRMRPKYLKLLNTDSAQGLSIEACTDSPYDDRRHVEVSTWRFNLYPDNWMQAAERYKQWLAATYRLQPLRERGTAWMDDIALTWTASISVGSMQAMAKRIDPRHVLVVDLGWAKGFNRNCPYYEPRNANLTKSVEQAHALGFRCGVYVAEKLVDRHANPELFQRFGLRVVSDALSQDEAKLDALRSVEEATRRGEKSGGYLVSVHPGSSKWSDFYADLMVQFHRQYGMDLFYQDVSGAHNGSAGLVEERTVHEGTVACEREIRRRLPAVALGGEYWNEVNVACGQDMGLQNFMSWFGPAHNRRLADNAHPVLSYVFGEYCSYMSYKVPVRSGAVFHLDQNVLETIGALPTWRTHVNDEGSEARVVMERAKLFMEGFRPHFPAQWDKAAVAYMRAPDGRRAKYIRRGSSTFCFEQKGQRGVLRYGRVHGARTVTLDDPVVIDQWAAYGASGPIGLDPERWYCVFPGKPTDLPVVLTQLPDRVSVTGTRLTDAYCLIHFSGDSTGQIRWETRGGACRLVSDQRVVATGAQTADIHAPTSLVFAFEDAAPMAVDDPIPLGNWRVCHIAQDRVIGPADWHYPPKNWNLGGETLTGHGVFPITGGKSAETSIDGWLRLPADPNLALTFSMGRLGGKGDGVHFVVRVNGEEVWRQFSEPGRRGWTSATVPLNAYAGREVVLSLAVDCGPSGFNTSNDQSLWGEPRLVHAATEAQ